MINKTNNGIFIPIYHIKYLLALQRAVYRSDVRYVRCVLVVIKIALLMLAIVLFSSVINHLTGFDIWGNFNFAVFIRLVLAYIIFTVAAYLANKEMDCNH